MDETRVALIGIIVSDGEAAKKSMPSFTITENILSGVWDCLIKNEGYPLSVLLWMHLSP